MLHYRQSILLKVVALAMVFVFSAQQLAFADRVDLRDGAGFEDFALAIAAGYFAGQSITPSWNVIQVFVYTYLIPELCQMIVKKMGLKGVGAQVVSSAMSTFLVSSMDYASSNLANTGNQAQDTLSDQGSQATSNVGSQATSNVGSQATSNAASTAGNTGMQSIVGSGLGNTVRNMGSGLLHAGSNVWVGALIDAATAAAMTAAKHYIAKAVDNKLLGEALGYLAAKYGGQYMRTFLQKEFQLYLSSNPESGPTSERATEDTRNEVTYYNNRGEQVTEYLTNQELATLMSTQSFSNTQLYVNGQAVLLQQGSTFLTANGEQVTITNVQGNMVTWEYYDKSGGFHIGTGSSQDFFTKFGGELRPTGDNRIFVNGKLVEVKEGSQFLNAKGKQLIKITKVEGGKVTWEAYDKSGKTRVDGGTGTLEEFASRIGGKVVPAKGYLALNPNKVTDKFVKVWDPSKGKYVFKPFKTAIKDQMSSFWKKSRIDDVRVIAQTLLGLAGLKEEYAIMISSGAAGLAGGSFKEGLYRGIISAALQYMSTKTKSPLHGAVFAAGATAALQWPFITRDRVAQETEGMSADEIEARLREDTGLTGDERQALERAAAVRRMMDDPNLSEKEKAKAGRILDLMQGKKDLSLLTTLLKYSITQANASFYSFGRATPELVVRDRIVQFDFNWVSGNDVFFLNRYTDYVKDVQENGWYSAMVVQYVNAMHYQAVSNIYSIVSGEVSNNMYVKRLRSYYTERLREVFGSLAEVWQKALETLRTSKEKLLNEREQLVKELLQEIQKNGSMEQKDAERLRDLNRQIADYSGKGKLTYAERNALEDAILERGEILQKYLEPLLADKKGPEGQKKQALKPEDAKSLSEKYARLKVIDKDFSELDQFSKEMDFGKLRALQQRKEAPLGFILNSTAFLEPIVVGLGAQTLGKDIIEEKTKLLLEKLQVVQSTETPPAAAEQAASTSQGETAKPAATEARPATINEWQTLDWDSYPVDLFRGSEFNSDKYERIFGEDGEIYYKEKESVQLATSEAGTASAAGASTSTSGKPQASRSVTELISEMKKSLQDYIDRRSDEAIIRRTGGWQILSGVYGGPTGAYGYIDPKVRQAAQEVGVKFDENIPPELLEKRIKATPEYQDNFKDAVRAKADSVRKELEGNGTALLSDKDKARIEEQVQKQLAKETQKPETAKTTDQQAASAYTNPATGKTWGKAGLGPDGNWNLDNAQPADSTNPEPYVNMQETYGTTPASSDADLINPATGKTWGKAGLGPDGNWNLDNSQTTDLTSPSTGDNKAASIRNRLLQPKINELVAKEMSKPETQSRITEAAAKEAYTKTQKELLASRGKLAGVTEYLEFIGRGPMYLERWQPNRVSIPTMVGPSAGPRLSTTNVQLPKPATATTRMSDIQPQASGQILTEPSTESRKTPSITCSWLQEDTSIAESATWGYDNETGNVYIWNGDKAEWELYDNIQKPANLHDTQIDWIKGRIKGGLERAVETARKIDMGETDNINPETINLWYNNPEIFEAGLKQYVDAKTGDYIESNSDIGAEDARQIVEARIREKISNSSLNDKLNPRARLYWAVDKLANWDGSEESPFTESHGTKVFLLEHPDSAQREILDYLNKNPAAYEQIRDNCTRLGMKRILPPDMQGSSSSASQSSLPASAEGTTVGSVSGAANVGTPGGPQLPSSLSSGSPLAPLNLHAPTSTPGPSASLSSATPTGDVTPVYRSSASFSPVEETSASFGPMAESSANTAPSEGGEVENIQ